MCTQCITVIEQPVAPTAGQGHFHLSQPLTHHLILPRPTTRLDTLLNQSHKMEQRLPSYQRHHQPTRGQHITDIAAIRSQSQYRPGGKGAKEGAEKTIKRDSKTGSVVRQLLHSVSSQQSYALPARYYVTYYDSRLHAERQVGSRVSSTKYGRVMMACYALGDDVASWRGNVSANTLPPLRRTSCGDIYIVWYYFK